MRPWRESSGEADTYVVGVGTVGQVVGHGLGDFEVQFPGLTFTTHVHPDHVDIC